MKVKVSILAYLGHVIFAGGKAQFRYRSSGKLIFEAGTPAEFRAYYTKLCAYRGK